LGSGQMTAADIQREGNFQSFCIGIKVPDFPRAIDTRNRSRCVKTDIGGFE
jgi:hypothetical protein